MGFGLHPRFPILRLTPPPPRRGGSDSPFTNIHTYDTPFHPYDDTPHHHPYNTTTITITPTTPRPPSASFHVDYYGFRYYSPELGRWIAPNAWA